MQIVLKEIELVIVCHVHHLVLYDGDCAEAKIHGCHKFELVGRNQEDILGLPILSQDEQVLQRLIDDLVVVVDHINFVVVDV